MAGQFWDTDAKQWVFDKIAEGVHPIDMLEELNEKFPTTKRTISAIYGMLRVTHTSYSHCTAKYRIKPEAIPKEPKEIKEVVEEDSEKLRTQQKLTEVRSKYEILVKEKSLGDRLTTVLKDEIQALPKVDLSWRPVSRKPSKETAGLLLGDLHIGEKVIKEEVYGLGEYNFDIFVKRLKFLEETIKHITVRKLSGYKIDKLVILCMGDMVSGRIHDELIENAEDIIFQVLNGAYVTSQFILNLSKMFPSVEVAGVLGNHGRLTKRPHFKKRFVNWDFIFYSILSMFLANNPRISCNFPKSFFTIKEIQGWNFLVLHGDNIRSWQSIPWYGIERNMYRFGDLLSGMGKKVEYKVLGHFHSSGEIDKTPGEIILNGSMIGGNEFSLGKLFSFDRPTQLFFGVHKKFGMTWRYPLRLDFPEVSKMKPYAYNESLNAGKYMKEILKQQEEEK